MSAKAAPAEDALRQTLLDALATFKTIADLRSFCEAQPDGGLDYALAEGCCRGLAAAGYVVFQDVSTTTYALTEEAQGYAAAGTPEFQFVQHVPAEGRLLTELQAELGQLAGLGLAKAMAARWIRQDKATGMIHRAVEGVIEDTIAVQLRAIATAGGRADAVSDKDVSNLKKRKLLKDVKITSLVVKQGPNFSPTFRKLVGDLTKELLEGCVA
jgi:phenylalanyl-tRNA synthetase alpha chain